MSTRSFDEIVSDLRDATAACLAADIAKRGADFEALRADTARIETVRHLRHLRDELDKALRDSLQSVRV